MVGRRINHVLAKTKEVQEISVTKEFNRVFEWEYFEGEKFETGVGQFVKLEFISGVSSTTMSSSQQHKSDFTMIGRFPIVGDSTMVKSDLCCQSLMTSYMK
ncbi:Uncharacterized protein Fot_28190 [Forsythia ovata]|uniref:Uncharacterized protein n=1 Tax=Forsythia ovata TaxID=205694 RepID=A0ABD1TNF5_9LAMI